MCWLTTIGVECAMWARLERWYDRRLEDELTAASVHLVYAVVAAVESMTWARHATGWRRPAILGLGALGVVYHLGWAARRHANHWRRLRDSHQALWARRYGEVKHG